MCAFRRRLLGGKTFACVVIASGVVLSTKEV